MLQLAVLSPVRGASRARVDAGAPVAHPGESVTRRVEGDGEVITRLSWAPNAALITRRLAINLMLAVRTEKPSEVGVASTLPAASVART